MPSPWIDLLSLHGYITDFKLLRQLAMRSMKAPRREADAGKKPLTLAGRVARTTRLCLGIGDGVARSQ